MPFCSVYEDRRGQRIPRTLFGPFSYSSTFCLIFYIGRTESALHGNGGKECRYHKNSYCCSGGMLGAPPFCAELFYPVCTTSVQKVAQLSVPSKDSNSASDVPCPCGS